MARGYGSAGGGRPVTSETQFYIGSCTKSFTALAIMPLVERGQLELDAPVRRYLPWFRVADDEGSARITVRHLLNRGARLVFHGGSLERFQADMLLLPEQKRAFVILVNENGVLRPLLDPDPPWMGLALLARGNPGPSPPPSNRRAVLFATAVAADLGIGLWRISRLRRWKQKAARRSRRARWWRASIDAALPAAFLMGFPKLLGLAVRTDVTWAGSFDFVPDVATWFLASAGLSLVRGAAKVVMVARWAR